MENPTELLNQKEIDLFERFWSKVDIPDLFSCWIWKGYKLKDKRYGKFWYQSRDWFAHRLSWLITYGDIPENMCVLHKCDNPKCINPAHLFIGTNNDNVHDMVKKHRNSCGVGIKNSHAKLNEELVIGIRIMRQCEYSYGIIANLYNVTPSTIRDIDKHRTWKHI